MVAVEVVEEEEPCHHCRHEMPLVRGLLHSNDGRQSWLHEQTTLDSRQTVCKPLDISLLLMRGVLDVDDALQKSTIEIQNNYQYAVCLGAGHH